MTTTGPVALEPVKLQPGLRYAHLIHPPTKPMDGLHVPVPELELAVQTHAMMLRSQNCHEVPRLFLIQSEPGTGKSTAVLHALLSLGTAVARLPPSIFGSKMEGGAVENVTEVMHACERYSAQTKQHVAVNFDDIDASTLSISENTGHTVNTKDLIGHMQTLADNKSLHIAFDGSPIPFIATANAASEVRASLFRNMRAKVYTHVLPAEIKREIVLKLFEPVSPEEQRIVTKLFRTYVKEQPAFWKALLSDLKEHHARAVVSRHGANLSALNAELVRRHPLDEELLFELAKKLRTNRPTNFLFNRNA